MSQYIKYIKVTGLHARFDTELEFQDGVNIVYGHNGTGKTTLLHILANAVNENFGRFSYLKFQSLEIKLDDDQLICIKQHEVEDRKRKTKIWLNPKQDPEFSEDPEFSYEWSPLKDRQDISRRRKSIDRTVGKNQQSKIDLKATYFPAFRSMIEAWSTLNDREFMNITGRYISSALQGKFAERAVTSTELARLLFGQFVPILNYPSPLEIQKKIDREIIEVQLQVAISETQLLSDAFVEAFESISPAYKGSSFEEDPEEILKKIQEFSDRLQTLPLQVGVDQTNNVYARLQDKLKSFSLENNTESKNTVKRVLSVYKNSLQKRLNEQASAYSNIEKYLDSVNSFFEDKKLKILSSPGSRLPRLGVQIGDEKLYDLKTLSSGERQIVGLIYAASHMTRGEVVLIDEPEISLHIDWQRKLLSEMLKQLGNKQLIVCTHSPVVASQYRDRMIELKLDPTSDPSLIEYEEDMIDSEFDNILPDNLLL